MQHSRGGNSTRCICCLFRIDAQHLPFFRRDFYSTGGQGENLVEGHTECQSSRSVAITIIERILTFVPPADVQTNSTDPAEANLQENDGKNRHLECVKLVYESLPERVWDGIAVTHPEVRDLVTEATRTKFVDDPYEDSVSPHTVAAARDQARRMPQESLYDTPHDVRGLPLPPSIPPGPSTFSLSSPSEHPRLRVCRRVNLPPLPSPPPPPLPSRHCAKPCSILAPSPCGCVYVCMCVCPSPSAPTV